MVSLRLNNALARAVSFAPDYYHLSLLDPISANCGMRLLLQ
jgi:hypothetical protein